MDYSNENMFSAINKLLTKMDIKHKNPTSEKIPPIEIQLQYLELLRLNS